MSKETKITNEKTVKIPLPFEEALAVLLKAKPPEKDKEKQKQEDQLKPNQL